MAGQRKAAALEGPRRRRRRPENESRGSAGDLAPPKMDDDLVSELVAHLAVQVVSIAACFQLAKKVWPKHEDPWMLADLLTSIVVFPLLVAAAVACVLNLHQTVTSRWTGVTPETRFFLLLYIARCLVHIPVQFMEKMSQTLLVGMTVHHVITIFCFGYGLVLGRMHFWACLAGCCEISTVFLNNMCCGKEFRVQDRRLQDMLPKLFAANGICLWLSFLFFRIILFPAWLYYWHQDLMTHPELTWTQSSAVQRRVFPAVIFLLLVLSISWFVPMTKGMRKAVRVLLGSASSEEEEGGGDEEAAPGYEKLQDK